MLRRRPHARYQGFQVLLVQNEEDDLEVDAKVEKLEVVFSSHHLQGHIFSTQGCCIPI